MSEENTPVGDAEAVRLRSSSDSTAVVILAIGWIGGVISHLLVSEVGGWLAWVVAVAILFACTVWGLMRSRLHTLYAAVIGASMATMHAARGDDE